MATNKRRVQLDFSENALAELDQLQADVDLPTRAELIKQSLRLFYWMWKEQKRGRILVEDENGIRQIMFPYWDGSLGGKRPTAVQRSEFMKPAARAESVEEYAAPASIGSK